MSPIIDEMKKFQLSRSTNRSTDESILLNFWYWFFFISFRNSFFAYFSTLESMLTKLQHAAPQRWDNIFINRNGLLCKISVSFFGRLSHWMSSRFKKTGNTSFNFFKFCIQLTLTICSAYSTLNSHVVKDKHFVHILL